MLAQTDPDKIVDYFFVQSCLWTVGQHYAGKFLVQCWLRQTKTTLYMAIFLRKDDYVVWANIAPVIFLCNVVSDVFGGQYWIYDITVQFCPNLIDTTLYYFAKKICLLTMRQNCTVKT